MAEEHQHTSKPAEWLIDNITLLPKGRALDVAMGTGRNAIFLAQQGYEVKGVDISPEAVAEALDKARQVGVEIKTEVADLEAGFLLPINTYDVIICFNYLQRSLIPDMKAALKAGGMMVYETYIVDQAQFGKPSNPDFLLKHNELLEDFRDFRVLRYREGLVGPRQYAASIVAEKE
jgi:2-polyprenyl-3-methyl-5-hydroxy-6-metoxy-1,4-benzoquinol methylase